MTRQKSHRVAEMCYRSDEWTLPHAHASARGYTLYLPTDVQIPPEFEAGGGRLRRCTRQFEWRSGSAQGARRPARADGTPGQMADRPAPAGTRYNTILLELVHQRVFGIAYGSGRNLKSYTKKDVTAPCARNELSQFLQLNHAVYSRKPIFFLIK